jgi:hypothetical protein
MKIIIKNNTRLLVKDDGSKVNIENGDAVEYLGVYYNYINNDETKFVGIVETERYGEGIIQGIYIKPLYIWSIVNGEWLKINDYEPPITKYFLYPHLLMLPEIDYPNPNKYLYFLHTCHNIQLCDYNSITKEFSLSTTDYN